MEKAAETLYKTRVNARAGDQLPAELRPASIDESYALQEILNQKLVSRLGSSIGYKIGCTTSIMQEYLQIPHPCAGQIFEATVQFGQGSYAASNLCRAGVECEIAVQLERDMPADQTYTAQSCVAFASSILPSIELVDDRWVDYQSIDVHSLIADNFFGAGCVLGAPVSTSFVDIASTIGVGSVVKTQWLAVGDVVEIEFTGLGGCALELTV